jgi:L-methionine (R)-S-oxide reductase
VVPVRGVQGDLIAVLDIDSEKLDAFNDDDQRGLERLVSRFATKTQ